MRGRGWLFAAIALELLGLHSAFRIGFPAYKLSMATLTKIQWYPTAFSQAKISSCGEQSRFAAHLACDDNKLDHNYQETAQAGAVISRDSVDLPVLSTVDQQEAQYQHTKISLVGELARIYWERIVLYGLCTGGSGLEWTDLVLREPQYFGDIRPSKKEKFCHRVAKISHPEMKAGLVTPAFKFIQEFGLPEPHIPVSVFETPFLVQKVRDFKFRRNDPHKKLAMKLCDVIDLNVNCGFLASYGLAREHVLRDCTANDVYAEFAERRRADLTGTLDSKEEYDPDLGW